MAAVDVADPLTLPEGSRLFYIGPPKTGTTSLQEAAREARETLYEHGVHYPGSGRNHRAEVLALMGEPEMVGMRVGTSVLAPGTPRAEADRVPPMTNWTALRESLDSTPAERSLVSHEFAATASDGEAAMFVRELGEDRTHVVITLRPLWATLASLWNQMLKRGVSDSLEQWLERFYGPADDVITTRMRRYLDQGGLVERWASAVGPDRVTVIIVDKNDKDLLTDTFEQMLDVPAGTLTGVVSGGRRTNRSMSRPETEVFRQVNGAIYEPTEMSWPIYLEVVRKGAIDHLLEARTPGDDEHGPAIPDWAVARLLRDAERSTERIARSGVRIIGDLDRLRVTPPVAGGATPANEDTVQEIAVESMIGAIRGATAYERRLARRTDRLRRRLAETRAERDRMRKRLEQEKAARQRAEHRRRLRDEVRRLPSSERPRQAAESFGTRDLAKAFVLRLKLRLRGSHPRRAG